MLTWENLTQLVEDYELEKLLDDLHAHKPERDIWDEVRDLRAVLATVLEKVRLG